MDLNEIYETHQALGLGGKNGTSERFVPGDGPCPSNIMIIGEAPGAKEDEIGKPFQGAAGKVLDRLLGFSHVKREDLFITNSFKYRPPNNREPTRSELISSFPCLSAEIKCVNPRVIILTGKIAISCIFPGKSVRSLRGKVIEKSNRKIVCTYHPAIILHDPRYNMEALLRSDFSLAVKTAREKS